MDEEQSEELEIRLSFRLRDGAAQTWLQLRQRHEGATGQFVFEELLRRERLRLENRRTHSDMLDDIRVQTAESIRLLMRIIELLETDNG